MTQSNPHRPVLIATTFVALLTTTLAAQEDPDPVGFFDRSPFLQQLTARSVIIVTQSKDPRIACLRVGNIDGRNNDDCDFADTESTHNHVFAVDGLEPDSLIEYELSDGVHRWRSSFQSLPLPGSALRIGVVGDSGQPGPGQDGVVETLLGMDPHLVLHTGDSAYNFGFPLAYQWHFFDPFAEVLSSTGYSPSVGNHDCLPLWCFCEYHLDAFVLPSNSPTNDERNYSFDAGDAHFVSLDTVCSSYTEPV
jgi:hypothetical protein